MRNYIDKKGIKNESIIYATPKGSKIKISNAGMDRANAEVLEAAPGGSPIGAKGMITISEMPGLQALITETRKTEEEAFTSKYPHMDTLLDIINGHLNADDDFGKMMESGSSKIKAGRPKTTIADAKIKYANENAYLVILKLADSNPASEIGFIRRQAGDTAILALHRNLAATLALEIAKKEIEEKTNTKEYAEHCAGL